MAQRVNPQISQQIIELVRDGMTNPQDVRKALNHYVRTVLCPENPPDPDDRAYFPANRDLKNYIYKAKRAFELSKFDQHNLAKKIGEWEKTYPESRHYFRPYISVPEKQILIQFRQTLPAEQGLVIRPLVTKRVKTKEKSKLARNGGQFSSLPLYKKRGRSRVDSKYRNRVGKRAQQLRNVC